MEIKLPVVKYYIGLKHGCLPQPSGGWINRKNLKECPAWIEKEKQ